MDNFSAKQVRFHRKVVLFFQIVGHLTICKPQRGKESGEKGEERQHEENRKSGFIEKSTAVPNTDSSFCHLNKAHPIIYL